MKNSAVLILLAVCLVFTGFLGGFFLGRNINHADVQHGISPAVTTQGNQEKLNINTATAAELEALPGIGPVLAERIIAYRQEHGDFTTTEQLLLVKGIGSTLLASLENLITTGG